MIAFLLVCGAVVGLWVMRRRARAAQLHGLDSARPVFGLEPPARRHHGLKGERL